MALTETSPQAILPLATSGVTTLTVNTLCDSMTEAGGADFGVGVYVDGAWNQVLTPTVDGINSFNISLGGGAHTVDLWNSYQNFHRGSFVYSYSTSAGTVSVRTVTTPARRGCLYTDSIGCGALASPLTEFSYFARLRTVYPGRLGIVGWGGRALWDDQGYTPGMMGVGSITNLAARLVSYVQLNSPATRDILLAIGTNDATYSGSGRQSAANFGTNYAALLDSIHALDSSVRVYAISLLVTGLENASNSFGDKPPAYRTQIANAASARSSYVTYVNGLNLMTSGGLSGDALHPTNNGHLAVFDGSGSFGSSTNLRAVLSV